MHSPTLLCTVVYSETSFNFHQSQTDSKSHPVLHQFTEGVCLVSLLQVSCVFCRMTAAECLAQERIWFDKPRYDEAERQFYERMNGPTQPKQVIYHLSISSMCANTTVPRGVFERSVGSL